MLIAKSLNDIPPIPQPIALTIGTFDSLHLGHRYLIEALKKHGTPVVLTFSNHPSTVLSPSNSTKTLYSPEEKLKLLDAFGVYLTVFLKFTPELAQIPYDSFLRTLKKHLPFTTLLLGEGASFGHKGQGTEQNVKKLEKELSFHAIYLKKALIDEKPISSSRIRTLLEQNRVQEAEKLLGRKLHG